VGLDDHRVVGTAVPLAASGDDYKFGSGYLIANGMVLTAAHVLEPAEGMTAQKGQQAEAKRIGGDWQAATVAWVDAARDVAVLSCPGLRADGGIRWGRLTGPDPVDWGAAGFPAASADHAVGRRAEHVFGRTSPISDRIAGRLALTVESRKATGGDSPWAGLSGAAVFCGDYLVGVVTAVPATYAESLIGRRAEDFCHDAELAQLLGGVPELENVEGSAREPGLANLRSTLPSRNRSFTGRERDLQALTADANGRTVLAQRLIGLGGVGKSALALEYAHRRYTAGDVDLAWWFVAEDRSVLMAKMAEHYSLLTGAQGSAEDAEAGAVALKNWLERSGRRWVIVFDNANPGTLDGILPEEGTGQVIITSRFKDWRDVGFLRMVGNLPADEAAALLAKITKLPANDEARQITRELDGLALAIEQAAAYIRQTHTDYRDYLSALRDDARSLYKYDADLDESESVAARVLGPSLKRVTGGQDSHPAAVMLGVMSYLAPDDIPRQVFNQDATRRVQLLDVLGPVKLNIALGELDDYSLIVFDDNQESISVHRVVQHLTRLDAESKGLGMSYCAAAIGLLDACI
jgi:hypothetical protein